MYSTIFQEPFVKSFNTITDYAFCKLVEKCKKWFEHLIGYSLHNYFINTVNVLLSSR